jgi:hypothetical protein
LSPTIHVQSKASQAEITRAAKLLPSAFCLRPCASILCGQCCLLRLFPRVFDRLLHPLFCLLLLAVVCQVTNAQQKIEPKGIAEARGWPCAPRKSVAAAPCPGIANDTTTVTGTALWKIATELVRSGAMKQIRWHAIAKRSLGSGANSNPRSIWASVSSASPSARVDRRRPCHHHSAERCAWAVRRAASVELFRPSRIYQFSPFPKG